MTAPHDPPCDWSVGVCAACSRHIGRRVNTRQLADRAEPTVEADDDLGFDTGGES